jgi:uncharacterized membrane protein
MGIIHKHIANIRLIDQATLGERSADKVAKAFGSWKFIWIQTALVILWMVLNVIGFVHHWDPYPFILLNLCFSTQAAYAAPVILLSQNRQSEHDRLVSEHTENVSARDMEVGFRIAEHLGIDISDLKE